MKNSVEFEIERRKLPDIGLNDRNGRINGEYWQRRRQDIIGILEKNLYGVIPDFECEVTARTVAVANNAYGGKAVIKTLELQIKSPFSYVSFPFQLCLPKGIEQAPVFLYFAFSPYIADGVGEEIVDHGYAIAHVYYQDIAPDRDDGYFGGMGRFAKRNAYDGWGKLAMWAFGGRRMLDYLIEQPEIDDRRIGVMGHSRLGKTALVCGIDQRFSLVIANNSGGGGASLFRGNLGEGIEDMAGHGSRIWFCGNLFKHYRRAEDLPFDQHFLLALMAPRYLYIASASEDAWSDPVSEYLACKGASPVYELLGYQGLVDQGEWPKPNDFFHKGRIGYHLRKGTHHLGRFDWQKIIQYRERHRI